jgi:hypothetical protein
VGVSCFGVATPTVVPPSQPSCRIVLRTGVGQIGASGGRASRPTTCEALVSWSPRACRAGSRGEVMRSTRHPGETPGTCWLVADAAALPVAFMAAGAALVNRAPDRAGPVPARRRRARVAALMRASGDTPRAARPIRAGRESVAAARRPGPRTPRPGRGRLQPTSSRARTPAPVARIPRCPPRAAA